MAAPFDGPPVSPHNRQSRMSELFPPDLAAPASQPYRVLARKYRPIGFEHLIGQEPMVRTLANSFASGRIHQAYILTGVRGIGKTTTARILARAFNYDLPGKIERPSIEMSELGVHCQAIIESRHVDVIEMDAASNTGIDDVREIIDNARYRPVSARTKVYIIDEVHMLSKQAFNGLLKTLEEPPGHVKFLFATTEIEKVPVTVRSRCLRFDLKRVDSALMARHLASICAAEGVECEPEALALIARIAEGSVRDALSLLDQAIAHGGDGVRAADIRGMLGLSDRSQTIDLFESTVAGDISAALAQVGALFDAGADPLQILIDLAEFSHLVTRMKLAGKSIDDPAISEDERRRGAEFAGKLGVGALTRAWQILLKGVQDVKDSPRPLASVEMALVRLAYAAELPSPEDALRRLAEAPDGAAPRRLAPGNPPAAPAYRSGPGNGGGASARAIAPQASAPAPTAPGPRLQRFEDVVTLARARRDIQLHSALESDVRLERFEPGQIAFSLVEGASPQIAQTLSRRLGEWTGERWMVSLVGGASAPTLREVAKAAENKRLGAIASHPLVSKVLRRFPGATIIEAVRVEEATAPPEAPPVTDDDVSYSDANLIEDEF
jgi:DNA polymerase III subunit gamma/tau